MGVGPQTVESEPPPGGVLRRHRRTLALVVWAVAFVVANATTFHQPWAAIALVFASCAALVGIRWLRARRQAE